MQRKYADRPRDELIALYLMALEGKELVTVGYREDLINRRLESMPLSEHFLGDQFASAIWVEQGTAGSAAPRGFFRAIRTFLPRSYRLPQAMRDDLWECFQQREVRHFVVRMCAGY